MRSSRRIAPTVSRKCKAMSADITNAATIEAMVRAGAALLSGSQSPRLDARVLAKFVLDCDDAALIARATDLADGSAKEKFGNLILRRASGEPIAYITGQREFWGMPFRITPDVLVPRGDSECLVETVCVLSDRSAPLRILDLGTGSGCLLCALLSELPQASGVGVDISPDAVAIASENAAALGLSDRAEFSVSNWFENVNGEFDVVIANAPYIPETDQPGLIVDVSDYEPTVALFAGEDGLEAYRLIFDGICDYLALSGLFVLEYGDPNQGARLRALAAAKIPNAELSVIRDLAARERGLAVRRHVGKRD